MSRTRQNPNEMDLWLWPKSKTSVNNHVTDTESTAGIQFKAEDLGLRTRTEASILSGRAFQSGTVNVYKTMQQMNFNIGDNISTTAKPSRKDLSTIVNIKSKPQNKRGARHNTTRVIEYIIEVS